MSRVRAFFISSRRRHTRLTCDWSSDVCSSDLASRVAGTVLLVGALAYTFLPVGQRFESPFVDDGVSEDMKVSDFLNRSEERRVGKECRARWLPDGGVKKNDYVDGTPVCETQGL